MIIIRYLMRETLKRQLAILFILLLIFFCQNLVKIFRAAVKGEIPTNLLFPLLGLGVPEMAQIILPLSLSLGLLMTLVELYNEREITVMHACGLIKAMLVKVAMVLALLTSIIAMVNVMWAAPWSSRRQDELLAEAKTNLGLVLLAQGQFQQISDGNSVLFVEGVYGNYFHDVFIAQLHPNGNNTRPSVVIAGSGQLTQRKNGSRIVHLNNGTRFEWTAKLRDFRITNFQDYQAIIGHHAVTLDHSDTAQMDMRTLWNTNNDRANTELHWRLTLVFAVFMMVLMVIPMSVVSPRQGRFISMLPAMLLYLVFFLLQTAIKSNGCKDKLDSVFWMWLINGLYLLLAVLLNLWDTVPVRYVRANLIRKIRAI